MKEIIFYTRESCHLCEEAKRTLLLVQEEIPFILIERDIASREEWTEKYGLMIPVVECQGEIVQFGFVDFYSISKRLQAK
ncbi:glutaredoxin family protein [Bacillus sp. 2205SS5-2]|uniref:glutaredoxin family protein n=1 Tax=Bacillus sp. 2205SS5-2 TaxID=3109031 RepID=UPI0030073CC1